MKIGISEKRFTYFVETVTAMPKYRTPLYDGPQGTRCKKKKRCKEKTIAANKKVNAANKKWNAANKKVITANKKSDCCK